MPWPHFVRHGLVSGFYMALIWSLLSTKRSESLVTSRLISRCGGKDNIPTNYSAFMKLVQSTGGPRDLLEMPEILPVDSHHVSLEDDEGIPSLVDLRYDSPSRDPIVRGKHANCQDELLFVLKPYLCRWRIQCFRNIGPVDERYELDHKLWEAQNEPSFPIPIY